MKYNKQKIILIFIVLIFFVALVGCDIAGGGSDTTAPTVTSTSPEDKATGVTTDAIITATFSEEMDNTTIDTDSFTLYAGTSQISGTVTYNTDDLTASFTPGANLATGTTYTATITTAVTDTAGNAMEEKKIWTFTTATSKNLGSGPDGGPGSVDLGTAANYAILAKSGVSTTGTTSVIGDIGLSPEGSTSLTGFSVTMDSSGEYSTSSYVTGKLYAADYTAPTPSILTTAVSDMENAYTTAAGLSSPDYTDLGAGEIGGKTLEPGLYKWGTGVSITTDVVIWGSDTATWVFQIAEDLVVANGVKVSLAGGARAENIVWQVGSQASLGTTSQFAGTLLTKTNIPVLNGASVNGRLLSQTAVTLDANAITGP
ncbi:MAG: ice-binding family protein [Spirochaetota bacterium]